jgi:hypothetical protein
MPDQTHPTGSAALCDGRSLERAAQAMRCLPLQRRFYALVDQQAIGSQELSQHRDVSALCRRPLGWEQLEDQFIWLIQLGVLRREVDGQGLTQRVRLTPMGRQLLQRWPQAIPSAGPLTRLLHGLRRRWPRL